MCRILVAIVALSASGLAGCAQEKNVGRSNGHGHHQPRVTCANAYWEQCGWWLYNCTDGQSYRCMKNREDFKAHGPGSQQAGGPR